LMKKDVHPLKGNFFTFVLFTFFDFSL